MRWCARIGLLAALCLAAPASAAEQPLPRATVKARKAFFGTANVDRAGRVRDDRVLVSWFGVGSLAVSFEGRVVLLDTFLNNTGPGNCPSGPAAPSYVPATYDQLAALRPEAIFIGHEHFDHECRTGELIVRTGARLVGLPQACALATSQAAAFAGKAAAVKCVPTLSAMSPFGASASIRPLGSRIGVDVIRNVHSGTASGPVSNSGGAEGVLFRFTVGRFSLVWNDTVGPLREKAPGALDVLRKLPATDVQFGASLGIGVAEQGYRDPVDYMEALRAKRYYPLHQDFPGARDGTSKALKPAVSASLGGRPGVTTKLVWLQDPKAYLRPIAFDPDSPAFAR